MQRRNKLARTASVANRIFLFLVLIGSGGCPDVKVFGPALCAHRAEAVSGTVPKPFTFGLSKALDSQCPWVLRKIHIIAVRSFSLQSLGFLAPKHCIFNTLKIFLKQHRYHL